MSPANCAEVSIPQLHASKAKLAELKVLVAVPKTKPATPAMYPVGTVLGDLVAVDGVIA